MSLKLYQKLLVSKESGHNLTHGEAAYWTQTLQTSYTRKAAPEALKKAKGRAPFLEASMMVADDLTKLGIRNHYPDFIQYQNSASRTSKQLDTQASWIASMAFNRYEQRMKYNLLGGVDFMMQKPDGAEAENFLKQTGLNQDQMLTALDILKDKALHDQIDKPSVKQHIRDLLDNDKVTANLKLKAAYKHRGHIPYCFY